MPRRTFHRGLAAGLLAGLLGGAPRGVAENPSPLPEAPRVAMGTLYSIASTDPTGISGRTETMPEGPVVTLGRMAPEAQSGVDGDILVDELMTCCLSHSVAMRLSGHTGLDSGDWVAVYGRVVPADVPPVTARSPWRKQRPVFVAGGFELAVDRVVPAEHLVYPDNVVDLLTGESVTLFARALRESGLDRRLRVAEAVTVLVPVNHAIESLPESDRMALFDPGQRDRLGRFVLAHLIPERLSEQQLLQRSTLTTMDGATVPIRRINGTVHVGAGRILFADRVGRNGVLHLISPSLPVRPPPSSPTDPFDPLGF